MNLIRNAIALLVSVAVAAIAGCSHRGSTSITGPDGQQWYAVTCSHGMHNCWEEASDLCPHGYETADSSQNTSTAAYASGGTFIAGPVHRGEMLIRCARKALQPVVTAAEGSSEPPPPPPDR
jgi:hypothetical protein